MPGTHFPLLVARGCGRSWACRTERRCSYRPPSPGSCSPRVSWPTCVPHGKASHLQGEAQPSSGPGATLRHRHRQEQTPRLPGPRHYPEHPVGPAGTQGLCTGVCPLRKQASLQDTGAWGLLGVLAHVGVDSFQALRPHLPGSRPVLCQLSHHHSTTALLLLLSRRFAPGAAGGLGSPTLRVAHGAGLRRVPGAQAESLQEEHGGLCASHPIQAGTWTFIRPCVLPSLPG